MKQFSNQDNFYKRLRELADVDARTKSSSLDTTTLVEYVRANDGSALGIIKENDSFYIKSSNVKGDNLHAADFTYIGGLENKLKYKFNSLSEAVKNRNFKIGVINEGLERKFSVAKTINEEKELVAKTNADKGGVATAQDAADKSKGGEALKKDAPEKEVAEVGKDGGVAQAQSTADKKKSDDASQKLKQEHEASTATGSARTDIAKAQANADAQAKGEALKKDAAEKEIAVPTAKTGGEEKAQGEADKHKKDIPLKKEGHKEVKPASDAKKETAIVVENFGKSDGETEVSAMDAADVAPNAEPSGSEIASTPDTAGGAPSAIASPESDINAAAATIDNMDMAPEAGMGASAPTTGEEGAEDQAAAGLADMGLGDDAQGVEGDSDSAAALKDAEKLVGKTGQKVRSIDIPEEMAIGFLKSLISAFEPKLADADSEDKRELAQDIEKAGEEGISSKGSEDTEEPIAGGSEEKPEGGEDKPDFGAEGKPEGGEEGSEEAPEEKPEGGEEEPDDKEIEEAINSHLQNLAKNMGSDEKPVVNTANNGTQSSNVKPFKGYMAERGYTSESMNDCSIMEMASLVSGYANECNGMYDEADVKAIAEYMSPEVKEAVTEAGHHAFVKKVEPFVDKPKSFKHKEPNLMSEEIEEAKKLEEYGDEHAISTQDALAGKVAESTVEEEKKKVEENKKNAGFAPVGQSMNKKEEEDEAKKVDENWHKKNVVDPSKKGMFKGKTKDELHKELTHAKEKGDTTKEKEVNFALRAKNNWGKANESKEEDESKKVEEVSESVKKLRTIIQNKIQEQLGLKKKSLNESAKSKLSKQIDLWISEEIKKNKDFLKKYNVK
jgi:hypothetical protein